MMKDDDFKLLRGFADKWTNEQMNKRTDICDFRVAFATEDEITKITIPYWFAITVQYSEVTMEARLTNDLVSYWGQALLS